MNMKEDYKEMKKNDGNYYKDKDLVVPEEEDNKKVVKMMALLHNYENSPVACTVVPMEHNMMNLSAIIITHSSLYIYK